MTRPKAYDPQPGYRFQILIQYHGSPRPEWEHLSYAEDRQELKSQLANYRESGHGPLKTIALPRKYWPKRRPVATTTTKQEN